MKKKILHLFSGIIVSLVAALLVLLVLEGVVRITTDFKFRPKRSTRLPASKTYRLSKNKDLIYEMIPGARAMSNGIQFRINSSGFRDRHFRTEKNSSKRIMVIGDSITYGWNMDLENTFHRQLEKILCRQGLDVEVMAMGVAGYNTVQEFYLIRHRALKFKPDLIVLQITPNDFERTVGIKKFNSKSGFALIPFHDLPIPYVVPQTPVSTFLMRHSHMFRHINLKLFGYLKKRNPTFQAHHMYLLGEQQSFRFLRKIKSLLDKNSIPCAAVVFPEARRGNVYAFRSLHKKIHGVMSDMSMPYIDLHEALNINASENVWLERIHPNKKGHRIAGECLAVFLKPLLADL